jgi:hypothetical protein
MTIVRHGSTNDNGCARETFDKLVDAIERAIDRRIGDDEPFEALEKLLLTATNEGVRRYLEKRLQRIADSFDDRIRVGRHDYKRHQPGTGRYFSLCGAIVIERWTYRRLDERNGPTIVPVDLAAGLAEGATPALAFALAQGIAKAPVRSVEQDLKAAYRVPPSRTTMDRIVRTLGTLVNEDVDAMESKLRAREELPANAKALNLGLDRTTIPMEECEPNADGTSKTVVRYRMAYVGTVCVTDANCDALVTRKYAAPAHEGPHRIVARMKADLERALDQKPRLIVGVVQDGASEMWNLMRDMLRTTRLRAKNWREIDPRTHKNRWRETVDRFHLMEKLSTFLELIFPKNEKRRREIYVRWNSMLDSNEKAIIEIAKYIEERKWKAPLRVYHEIHRLFGNYFAQPKHFFYATLPALGLQQGSGVTEGSCKSLITMRAKRSGQRWRPSGISALLAIRCLLDSDRLDLFWPRFTKRFQATIRDAA